MLVDLGLPVFWQSGRLFDHDHFARVGLQTRAESADTSSDHERHN
jgi:hypothetical protein